MAQSTHTDSTNRTTDGRGDKHHDQQRRPLPNAG